MDYARIAFVGCGTHSTNNLYPMLKYARCRLAAVCDLDRELAKRNARIFGGESAYTDVTKMLDEQQIDGVMVVGPPEIHHQVGKLALARGLPVFMEKPPGVSLDQTRELHRIAREHDTFFMTGFMKRFGLTYSRARSMIQSGQFIPAAGFFKYAHWAMTNLDHILLGMSSHIIDLALSFFGPATSVTSMKHQSQRAISLAVTIRFQSGPCAQLMLDASQPRIQEHVEISGSIDGKNALFILDNVERIELHRQNQGGVDVIAPSMDKISPDFDLTDIQVWRPDYAIPNMGQTRHFIQGFAGEVREFCDAIIEKRQPYPTMEDSLRTMQIIDALMKRPDGTTELLPLDLS